MEVSWSKLKKLGKNVIKSDNLGFKHSLSAAEAYRKRSMKIPPVLDLNLGVAQFTPEMFDKIYKKMKKKNYYKVSAIVQNVSDRRVLNIPIDLNRNTAITLHFHNPITGDKDYYIMGAGEKEGEYYRSNWMGKWLLHLSKDNGYSNFTYQLNNPKEMKYEFIISEENAVLLKRFWKIDNKAQNDIMWEIVKTMDPKEVTLTLVDGIEKLS